MNEAALTSSARLLFHGAYAVAIGISVGCLCEGAAQAEHPSQITAPAPLATRRQTILRNMPTNSDQQCVGIAVVTESLLDGHRSAEQPDNIQDHDGAEAVARRIYRNLATRQRLTFSPHVKIDTDTVSVESPLAILKLSSLVTEFYKQDFARLSQTRRGREKLLEAQDSFISTENELDGILDAEADKTDAFFGSGTRVFPDGTVESTYHAFLIGKLADGNPVVYDPNDPGSPIRCELTIGRKGVEVRWACQYRDTGQRTTQRYSVVHKDRFFQLMLGE